MEIRDRPSTPQILTLIVLAAVAIFNLANWSLSFSGDAEIHLVFAKELLRGCFLCFNPGEVSGGETSMGYMLLVAAFAKLFSLAYAPLAMKALGLLSLLAIASGIYRISRRLGVGKFWAAIAAVVSLNLVGSVSQGLSGTENALFGALFIYWIDYLVKNDFFAPVRPDGLRSDAIIGLCAGVIFWLRPEIAPCLAFALIVKVGLTVFESRAHWPSFAPRLAISMAVCVACFAVPIAAYVLIYWNVVGQLPYGAGGLRRLLSILQDGAAVGPIWVNTKAVQRLLLYWPLIAAPAVAVWSVRKRHGAEETSIVALSLILFGLIFLYILNVLPAFHFARYTLYLWPLSLILAAWALDRLAPSKGVWSLALGSSLLVYVLAIEILETYQRLSYQGSLAEILLKGPSPLLLLRSMNSNQDQAFESQALFDRLGKPSDARITISLQEVQLRLRLDDRFIVRAYDGVTDPVLTRYIHSGYFDHDGYLIDQKVDFVLSPVNYNRSKTAWSIANMTSLSPGSIITRPGVRYTLLDRQTVKVDRLVSQSGQRHLSREEAALFGRPPLP